MPTEAQWLELQLLRAKERRLDLKYRSARHMSEAMHQGLRAAQRRWRPQQREVGHRRAILAMSNLYRMACIERDEKQMIYQEIRSLRRRKMFEFGVEADYYSD
ncbi:hypothetical protein HYH03_018840 [Edaphochlamys debaryana]|uniref:Uncharacterized protein n=1 Tax=Edaphochlamys debaryana TaxID=47281 RepID=A0A836BNY8_9CHLO|nr:hypothetical protein HYH03_018840 [Edaphochlamys debaryana]|eukprot:KAG2482214.1 hypothetical protein HYH03_018840 [Edaphochlamys debaryana]